MWKTLDCLDFVIAQIRYATLWALGFAGYADIAPMQDQPMVCIQQKWLGYDFVQFALDFKHCFTRCNTRAVRHPENMGVHSNSWVTEGRIQHYVGGLASNTRDRKSTRLNSSQ